MKTLLSPWFFSQQLHPFCGGGVGWVPLASFLLHVDNGKPSLKINGSFPTHELFIWSGKARDRLKMKIDHWINTDSKRDLLASLNKWAVIKLHLSQTESELSWHEKSTNSIFYMTGVGYNRALYGRSMCGIFSDSGSLWDEQVTVCGFLWFRMCPVWGGAFLSLVQLLQKRCGWRLWCLQVGS